MNKAIITVLLSFFVSINYANTMVNNTIKLPKHFKRLSTFSGDISDSKSFHLIMTKNKKNKKYTIHPYFFDGSNLTELAIIENKFPQRILSFHQQADILSLVFNYSNNGKSYIQNIDINLTSNDILKNDPLLHEDFISSFREKNRSVFIYKNKKNMVIREFLNSQVTSSQYVFDGKNDPIKTFFKDQLIACIKTDEYVKNGSTGKLKAYLNRNNIVFTKEDTYQNTIKTLELSFSQNNIKPSKIITYKLEDKVNLFDSFSSYVNGNNLYQLIFHKTEALLDIIDFKEGQKLQTIKISPTFNLENNTNESFEGIETFLKNIRKNKYKPTITVNKTINQKLRIRIDYVNVYYNYNHDFWWFHQHMQFHNQMMNNGGGFGPNLPDDYIFEYKYTNEENRYFELLVDENGTLLNEQLPETIFKKIDKRKYSKKLKELPNITNTSFCFLNNNFRYIGYVKNLNAYVINTNPIK